VIGKGKGKENELPCRSYKRVEHARQRNHTSYRSKGQGNQRQRQGKVTRGRVRLNGKKKKKGRKPGFIWGDLITKKKEVLEKRKNPERERRAKNPGEKRFQGGYCHRSTRDEKVQGGLYRLDGHPDLNLLLKGEINSRNATGTQCVAERRRGGKATLGKKRAVGGPKFDKGKKSVTVKGGGTPFREYTHPLLENQRRARSGLGEWGNDRREVQSKKDITWNSEKLSRDPGDWEGRSGDRPFLQGRGG